VLLDAVRANRLPSELLTFKAFENAIAVIMALGGSTNAVLHLIAIADAAGVVLTVDDFERIRTKVPVLCDLKPSGKYVATDLHRVGGVPLIMKMLLTRGLIHGDCMTITGKTIEETLADYPSDPPADQDIVRPFDQPLYAEGHLAILKGNLATEGAVAKITGLPDSSRFTRSPGRSPNSTCCRYTVRRQRRGNHTNSTIIRAK
jgi:dihydroxy-acid dehydratase